MRICEWDSQGSYLTSKFAIEVDRVLMKHCFSTCFLDVKSSLLELTLLLLLIFLILSLEVKELSQSFLSKIFKDVVRSPSPMFNTWSHSLRLNISPTTNNVRASNVIEIDNVILD
jgi:hypothetical protein